MSVKVIRQVQCDCCSGNSIRFRETKVEVRAILKAQGWRTDQVCFGTSDGKRTKGVDWCRYCMMMDRKDRLRLARERYDDEH